MRYVIETWADFFSTKKEFFEKYPKGVVWKL